MYKALIFLSKKSPDLFFIINKTEIKITDNEIESAGITFDRNSKKFIILLNKNFIDGFDTLSLAAIIEHEILHLVLNHVSQKKLTDKKLANIAFDAIINEIGSCFSDKKKLDKKLQDGIFLDTIEEKICENLDLKIHDSEYIYNRLKKLSDDDLESLTSFDSHLVDSSKESENELGDFLEDNAEKTESLLKSIGKKSKDFASFLSNIEKLKRDSKILNEISKFFNSKKSFEKKSTIKRPSRRFPSPIGRKKIKTKNLRLLLDTSGSMLTEDTLDKLKKTVSLAVNNDFLVDLIFGDTEKRGDFKNITKNFDFSKISGGGGTCLKFMHDDKSKKYDLNLIVTDLEINENDLIKFSKKNTLILCTTARKNDTIKTINI